MPPQTYTSEFLQAIPKTDLHCHLDGSLRLSTLIELAKKRGIVLPSQTPAGLRELVFKETYRDLPDYLKGFSYTCAVLNDEEALERAAYELGEDCLAEGVCYLEVRFAPQLHVHRHIDIPHILSAVHRGLDRVAREHQRNAQAQGSAPPFRHGLICCAMRMFTADSGPYFQDLFHVLHTWPPPRIYAAASLCLAQAAVDARDRFGLPIVGLDLAGAEAGYPAANHVEAYRYAHKNLLKCTVHAGEAHGPESIHQAVTELHADRIGHGVHLYPVGQTQPEGGPRQDARPLFEYIAQRRIPIEVCVTSNMQTIPAIKCVRDHPLDRMIKNKLPISLCTDNRLISGTTISRELGLAAHAFNLSPAQLRKTVLAGFKHGFFPGSYAEKCAYIRAATACYDRIAKEHGVLH